MTHKANDLALTIINTGEGYADRCAAARRTPRVAAYNFFGITSRAARHYDAQSDEPLTAADMLDAASQVAAYYAQHITEL